MAKNKKKKETVIFGGKTYVLNSSKKVKKKIVKKDFLRTLSKTDVNKLSPKERTAYFQAVLARRSRKKLEKPKPSLQDRLILLKKREQQLARQRKLSALKQQFSSSGNRISIFEAQAKAQKKILSRIPSSAPGRLVRPPVVQRPQFNFQTLSPQDREVIESEIAARREMPNEKIIQENVFGNEDFRGREDFTRIS